MTKGKVIPLPAPEPEPENDYSDIVTRIGDAPAQHPPIPADLLDIVSLPPSRRATIARRRREWMDEAASTADVAPIAPEVTS